MEKHAPNLSPAAQKLDTAFWGHPKPLQSLFFSELWERFSFYGFRAILLIYLMAAFNERGLELDGATASAVVGLFGGAIYLSTIPGGWLADKWLGQERAILYGALIMATGYIIIAISVSLSPAVFALGMILVIMGNGLFKTCISVMVGNLYDRNDPRRDGGFSIFYMGINLGSILAPLACEYFSSNYGWHYGFGITGVAMLFAMLIFHTVSRPKLLEFNQLLQRKNEFTLPQKGSNTIGVWVSVILLIFATLFGLIVADIIPFYPQKIALHMTYIISFVVISYFLFLFLFGKLNRLEKMQLVICFVLFVAATIFWAAFEQSPTSFNIFAKDYTDKELDFITLRTPWFQSLNPIFIVIFAPLFGLLWTGLARKNIEPNSFIKFALGLIFGGLGLIVMLFASKMVLSGNSALVSPLWLIACYFLITIGELCLSPIGLSTISSMAPKAMRGQVMGLWFTSISVGNLVAGLIGGKVNPEQLQDMPAIFLQCSLVLFGGALLLILLSKPTYSLMRKMEQAHTNSAG